MLYVIQLNQEPLSSSIKLWSGEVVRRVPTEFIEHTKPREVQMTERNKNLLQRVFIVRTGGRVKPEITPLFTMLRDSYIQLSNPPGNI